ncbi:MAG: TolC family protein, partial [Pirellulaceae bacterium]|nr:TolC family protein [Pirellulaceae bacterium]
MQRTTWAVLLIFALGATGCHSRPLKSDRGMGPYQPFQQQIEYPDVKQANQAVGYEEDVLSTPPPPSVRDPEETPKWPLTLEEAIRIALSNSQVIRDIGGTVLSNPLAAQTVYDPALQDTNPLLGVEAALSAFDAQFTTSLFMERLDRRFNNVFLASAGAQRQQNRFQAGISKIAPTGTRLALQNFTNYDRIVGPGLSLADVRAGGNRYEHVDETIFQASVRHPLLQGSGVEFNRIAGPNATPGNYNGVVLARINNDISLADFETRVRNLVKDVEFTYWELYFAYRDLDAKLAGRNLALESWRLEQRRVEAGARSPDQEAFAREQYFLAQAAVENALTARSLIIGAGGLSSAGTTGVYGRENELRNLLGLPASDGRLIVPASEPVMADVRFDWSESLASALARRVELRRQQWNIKRREMELIAARNFRKMKLDLVGEYRWRGFGDDLLGNGPADSLPGETTPPPQSAFKDLFSGDFQEWRVGLELTTPVGNRIGHAAVRNAELQLLRERSVFDQMQLRVSADLRSAFTELDRAFVVSKSNYNRRTASFIRLQAERDRNEKGRARLDLVLDAQRQAVLAESEFYRAIVDYNVALLNMHWARGTLLDSHRVHLAEGPWSPEAHASAAKQSRRFRPREIGQCYDRPEDVSRGEYPQQAPEFETVPTPAPAGTAEPMPGAMVPPAADLPPANATPADLPPVPP